MFSQCLSRTIQTHGSNIAVIEGRESISWRDFGNRIAQLAGGLKKIGCNPGDHVATLAGNTINHLTMMYAVSWRGCVLVPLNTRLSPNELVEILTEADVTILAGDIKNSELINKIVEGLDHSIKVIGLDKENLGEYSFDQLLGEEPIETEASTMSDLAALYYTGGTTGHPKGVMVNNGALIVQTLNLVSDLGINSETVFLHAPPIFHLAGAGVAHACAFSGASQVFLPKFNQENFIGAVAANNVSLLSLVPTMLAEMIGNKNVENAFKSVKAIVYGSAPISGALLKKVITKCPKVNLIQIYGQTECVGPCLILPPDRHTLSGPRSGKLATAGQANMTSMVRIVDNEGNSLPIGEPGEILIRSPSVMMGYWKQPKATQRALKNDWLHTGDIGTMDKEGFVTIVDRLKDMIVTGGENVFCGEVENVISGHPSVNYCSVFGLPDAKWGERVHAVICLKQGALLTLESLHIYCKKHIASFKCPKSLDFTDEPFPLSGVGKVRKDLLRLKYSN